MTRLRNPTSPVRLGLGLIFVTLGLTEDCLAGWRLLTLNDIQGLLLHFPATLVWSMGILLVQQGVARRRADAATTAITGWTVAALVIGFLMFPGLGTLGCTLAFSFSVFFRPKSNSEQMSFDTMDSVKVPALDRFAQGHAPQEVQHLVDVLREPNTEMRRVVIKTLSNQPGRESVQIIRDLLTDSNPDVRSDAAVVLTRMEDDFAKSIREARERAQNQPRDVQRQLQFAQLCYQFGTNGLLDSFSSQRILFEARDMLSNLTTKHPELADAWMSLAKTYYELGLTRDAIQALNEVVTLDANHDGAYLLAVDIAFREHQWQWLLTLVQQRRHASHEMGELMRWWSGIGDVTQREIEHG